MIGADSSPLCVNVAQQLLLHHPHYSRNLLFHLALRRRLSLAKPHGLDKQACSSKLLRTTGQLAELGHRRLLYVSPELLCQPQAAVGALVDGKREIATR